MQTVYVLFESYLDSVGDNEIIAIVEDKKTAKKFIKDYQKDPENDTYMVDIYYEEWDLAKHYADFKERIE